MKKSLAVYFGSIKAILFLVLLLSLFIYSCRKDIVNLGVDVSKPADVTVSSAKTWYETKYIGKSIAQLTYNIQNVDNSFDLSKYFNPAWEQAINYARYNDDVLEMPVDEASKIGILIGAIKSLKLIVGVLF